MKYERIETNMKISEELKARGLIAQMTDEQEICDLIDEGKATFYIGFDPPAVQWAYYRPSAGVSSGTEP